MRTTRIAALAVTVAAASAIGATQLSGHTAGAAMPPASPSAITAQAPSNGSTSTGIALKLAEGSDGAEVTILQQRLSALGLLSARPSGHYGPATQAAVARFDTEHGLAVSPGVTEQGWEAIAAAARSNSSAPSASGTPTSSAPAPQASTTTTQPSSTTRTTGTQTTRAQTTGTQTTGTQGTASSLDPRCLTGRVMCVSKRSMRLYWVVDGQVQDSWSIRVGMPAHPTREGVFSVYRMEQNSWSNLYHVNMPYAMYFSGGEAVHYSAQFASTGYGDGSHGCVNLRDRAGIAWLYSQVHLGDSVVVYH